MYSFILALILGGYLSVKFFTDKSSKKKFSKNYSKAEIEANMFYDTYEATINETNEVKNMILKHTSEIVELENELISTAGIKPTHPMLIWGYLARKGRIPHRSVSADYNADNPLSSVHDRVWSGVTGWKEMNVVELRNARLRFLVWYDNQLCSNGMKHKLMFAPLGDNTDSAEKKMFNLDNMRVISECHDLCSTVVFWEPTKLYVPDLNGVV